MGQHFWARGYYVSTVGRDEQVIREYIRQQEAEDKRLDQINLWRKRHRKVASEIGAALATPHSRFERLTI